MIRDVDPDPLDPNHFALWYWGPDPSRKQDLTKKRWKMDLDPFIDLTPNQDPYHDYLGPYPWGWETLYHIIYPWII